MPAIGVDLPALHDYAQATAQAVQGWLAPSQDLDRAMDTPLGEFNLGQTLELVGRMVNSKQGL